ncbi:MAG: DUF4410 domain-containing protein [Bradyrhizobium sp.]|nr:DUF4410 domain-containing protein [Bradyrhizobium sp.]
MYSRTVCLLAAALALAGCAQGSSGALLPGSATTPPPKAIIVTDFTWSAEVVAIDRGFTARLDRKGSYPTFERRPRTIARVNDEIVATIVASLREAGLEAQPGDEDALSLSDSAVIVKGALRGDSESASAKKDQIGFGAGRGGVIADMTVTSISSGGKRPVLSFATDGRAAGRPAAGRAASANNAAIAAALAGLKADPERLSPDVEAQARGLGRAAAEKIVAFAKERGWLDKPAVVAAVAQ